MNDHWAIRLGMICGRSSPPSFAAFAQQMDSEESFHFGQTKVSSLNLLHLAKAAPNTTDLLAHLPVGADWGPFFPLTMARPIDYHPPRQLKASALLRVTLKPFKGD
jgi:hypothetical protein